MKTKTLGGKYNVRYDPDNNCAITRVDRYDEPWSGPVPLPHGAVTAMWYHILELEERVRKLVATLESFQDQAAFSGSDRADWLEDVQPEMVSVKELLD